jgi:hypothetical protein
METPAVLQQLRLLFRDIGPGQYAVYSIRGTGASVDLQLWGTLSPFERTADDHRKIAEGFRAPVLDCCQHDCDRVDPPRRGTLPNEADKWWWHLAIGSGDARKAGYAIGARVPARDEAETSAYVERIQELFRDHLGGASDGKRGSSGREFQVPLGVSWVEVGDGVKIKRREPVPPELHRLRILLRSLRAGTCAVYRALGVDNAVGLDVWGVYSPYATTADNVSDTGEVLRRAATLCCELSCDKILPPHPRFAPDAKGRRFWNIVVGSGAMRRAGYAIGAAIPALDEAEAMAHIDTIQQMFGS